MTTVLDRFLKYVAYDTQSDAESTSYPSTSKQLVLLRDLAAEFETLGLSDVTVDEFGYVMATIPATTAKAGVPTIGFIARTTAATWSCQTIPAPCCGSPTMLRSQNKWGTTSSRRRARRCSARTTRRASPKS